MIVVWLWSILACVPREVFTSAVGATAGRCHRKYDVACMRGGGLAACADASNPSNTHRRNSSKVSGGIPCVLGRENRSAMLGVRREFLLTTLDMGGPDDGLHSNPFA
jgi:hypothetical protein